MATPPDKSFALVTMSFRDYANKPSHVTFRVSTAAAAAWISDTSTGLIAALTAAVNNVTLDRNTQIRVSSVGSLIQPDLPATDVHAANSSTLLLINQETTGERDKGRNRIPGRNDTNLGAVNGVVPIGGTATTQVAALVTAYNAVVLSEEGRVVEIIGATTPGRSEGV